MHRVSVGIVFGSLRVEATTGGSGVKKNRGEAAQPPPLACIGNGRARWPGRLFRVYSQNLSNGKFGGQKLDEPVPVSFIVGGSVGVQPGAPRMVRTYGPPELFQPRTLTT